MSKDKLFINEVARLASEWVKRRADFQARPKISEKYITHHRESNLSKMQRYQARSMALLARTPLSAELFTRFERKTTDMLDKSNINTEVALYSDLIQYLNYCIEHAHCPFPFDEQVVIEYLCYLSAAGRKCSTIDRYIASMVRWANVMELDDPRRTFTFKMRLREINKTVPRNRRQVKGMRADDLQEALKVFDPAIPRDCQDITLLFVGFETMCRQSELVSFDWHDFQLKPNGSGVLRLARPENDMAGEGDRLYLSANSCNLLLGWKAMSNHHNKPGPIFRGIYSDGKMGDRLITRGVQRCFKRIAKRLNRDASLFSGHSTRVGAAQEMIERNIDSTKVMLSGRWKSMGTLLEYTKRVKFKRGGMAELVHQLGWNNTHSSLDAERLTADKTAWRAQLPVSESRLATASPDSDKLTIKLWLRVNKKACRVTDSTVHNTLNSIEERVLSTYQAQKVESCDCEYWLSVNNHSDPTAFNMQIDEIAIAIENVVQGTSCWVEIVFFDESGERSWDRLNMCWLPGEDDEHR
ncbi:MAG: tyrosine-type recombinase/integrase [Candidatus Thiodiazotropha sp. (ex Lucinoma kastoroae)]|nr:tyrosine-type recombinase/integrase [Candidatus Thiodiazotropha sp. (ex Lucinoma kastoroae)]